MQFRQWLEGDYYGEKDKENLRRLGLDPGKTNIRQYPDKNYKKSMEDAVAFAQRAKETPVVKPDYNQKLPANAKMLTINISPEQINRQLKTNKPFQHSVYISINANDDRPFESIYPGAKVWIDDGRKGFTAQMDVKGITSDNREINYETAWKLAHTQPLKLKVTVTINNSSYNERWTKEETEAYTAGYLGKDYVNKGFASSGTNITMALRRGSWDSQNLRYFGHSMPGIEVDDNELNNAKNDSLFMAHLSKSPLLRRQMIYILTEFGIAITDFKSEMYSSFMDLDNVLQISAASLMSRLLSSTKQHPIKPYFVEMQIRNAMVEEINSQLNKNMFLWASDNDLYQELRHKFIDMRKQLKKDVQALDNHHWDLLSKY